MDQDNFEEKLKPPESDWQDYGYAAIRAGLSLIPVAGGPSVELLQFVLQPPLEKRQQEWMQTVKEALLYLHKNKGVTLDDLKSNDAFIDTVIQASHIAYRSSQDEKRKALKNAIVNSALPSAPNQSLQQMFLHWIDTFTVWHIRILELFNDPIEWAVKHNHQHPKMYSDGSSAILESAYPEMENQRSFYDVVWRDLYQLGLVGSDSLHVMMSSAGLLQKKTTDIGSKFLRFIQSEEG